MSDRPEPTMLPLPDIAGALDVPVTQVRQLLRDRGLVGVRDDGVLRIPAEFVADGAVLRGLGGTITLLADAGFSDAEIIDWMFAADGPADDSAVRLLQRGRRKEAHRRAQVAGF